MPVAWSLNWNVRKFLFASRIPANLVDIMFLERKAFRVAVLIFFDDTGDMMHHIYGDI
jgi:hypothetical protein